MIFLGLGSASRLGGEVPAADVMMKVYSFDLSAWPPWLLVLVGTLVAALGIWLGIKLLKLALWVMFFVVLLGGLAWAAWLLVM